MKLQYENKDCFKYDVPEFYVCKARSHCLGKSQILIMVKKKKHFSNKSRKSNPGKAGGDQSDQKCIFQREGEARNFSDF